MQTRNYPRVYITIHPELYARLKSYAVSYGNSRSGVIELALRDFFAKQPGVKSGMTIIKHNSDPAKIVPSASSRGMSWPEFIQTEGKGLDPIEALREYEREHYVELRLSPGCLFGFDEGFDEAVE